MPWSVYIRRRLSDPQEAKELTDALFAAAKKKEWGDKAREIILERTEGKVPERRELAIAAVVRVVHEILPGAPGYLPGLLSPPGTGSIGSIVDALLLPLDAIEDPDEFPPEGDAQDTQDTGAQ